MMENYINQGQATKLGKGEGKTKTNIINFIPHHPDKNINKPPKN